MILIIYILNQEINNLTILKSNLIHQKDFFEEHYKLLQKYESSKGREKYVDFLHQIYSGKSGFNFNINTISHIQNRQQNNLFLGEMNNLNPNLGEADDL